MAALRLSTGLHVIALAPSEFPIPSFFAKSLCAHIVIPSHLIIAGAALSAPRYHASTSLTEPAERLLRPVSVAAGVQGSSEYLASRTSNLQSVSSQPAVQQHISTSRDALPRSITCSTRLAGGHWRVQVRSPVPIPPAMTRAFLTCCSARVLRRLRLSAPPMAPEPWAAIASAPSSNT